MAIRSHDPFPAGLGFLSPRVARLQAASLAHGHRRPGAAHSPPALPPPRPRPATCSAFTPRLTGAPLSPATPFLPSHPSTRMAAALPGRLSCLRHHEALTVLGSGSGHRAPQRYPHRLCNEQHTRTARPPLQPVPARSRGAARTAPYRASAVWRILPARRLGSSAAAAQGRCTPGGGRSGGTAGPAAAAGAEAGLRPAGRLALHRRRRAAAGRTAPCGRP